MTIQYKLQIDNYTGKVGSVMVVGTNICIPFNPDNTDYQAFLAWCAEGNEPLPSDEAKND